MTEHPKVYLFDLDGTLLDSAPDLAAAANHMRVVRGLEPLPFETLRKTASSGARGLLGAAFGIRPEDAGYAEMAKEFYAGDDKRDIDAANGADVFSVAVQWGYLGSPQPVQDWCADLIVHNPSEILGIELTK